MIRLKFKEHRQTDIETERHTGAVEMLMQEYDTITNAKWLRQSSTFGDVAPHNKRLYTIDYDKKIADSPSLNHVMGKKTVGKLDELLNHLDAGIILIDSEHRIRWMNQKVKEWFGPIKLGEKRKCYRIQQYNENFCRICPTRRAISLGITTR